MSSWGRELIGHARRLPVERRLGERVEVWRGEHRIAIVERDVEGCAP